MSNSIHMDHEPVPTQCRYSVPLDLKRMGYEGGIFMGAMKVAERQGRSTTPKMVPVWATIFDKLSRKVEMNYFKQPLISRKMNI